MKQIPLTRGEFAIVDDEDYEELSKHKWQTMIKKNHKYATRIMKLNGRWQPVTMHAVICGTVGKGRSVQVDHKDHNGLNNQRDNLRVGSITQNHQNMRLGAKNTTGLKGIFRQRKKWRARIKVGSALINLGTHADILDAARAYDAAALKYFGEFACTNQSMGRL